MTSPAAGVDFDRNRIGQGELIAGISGLVLLIDLWFKWYGVSVGGGNGALKGFSIGVSASAWQAFSLIDIILFLVALVAIGVAVLRGLNRMPEMPYPPATLVAGAGGLALLLVLFRLIDTPVDTGGVEGVDVSRKFGLFLGLVAAAGVAYGGWRAMQDSGASFGSVGGAGGVSSTAPTTPMSTPASEVPSKEGPGAPPAGTSTGAPGGGAAAPPPAAQDPPPDQPPAGLAGDPGAGGGTTPPGIAGDRTPDEPGGSAA
jgi:hypothetical protein